MRAEFAALFHMQPSEIDALTPSEAMSWAKQADRIHAEIEAVKTTPNRR